MTKQPFFIPALIIFVISIPLILRLIPRNGIYGVRTLKTMSNDDIWYRSNRFGGWVFFISAVIYLLLCISRPMSGPKDSDFNLWLTHLAVFALPLIIGALVTHVYIRRQ